MASFLLAWRVSRELEVIEIVLISFREWLHSYIKLLLVAGLFSSRFSSLSESGFIPTALWSDVIIPTAREVLISFREWLHSYPVTVVTDSNYKQVGSHLFQRVASFLLQRRGRPTQCGNCRFSSLSESGFIPTGERN